MSPIEAKTSRSSARASSGENLCGLSKRVRPKARSRASGSARSCIQPCFSDSRMAPASFSKQIAYPRSVRIAGRLAFVQHDRVALIA